MKKKAYIVLVAFLLLAPVNLALGQELSNEKYKISMKSRTFVPPEQTTLESILNSAKGERVHVLIQFDGIPDASEKSTLSDAGIKLLNYIPRNTWFASMPVSFSPENPAMS